MAVRDTGARERARLLTLMIRDKLSITLPEIAETLALEASERAPTVDEEYNELNAPSGEQALVARSGDTSADTDGRTRFIKRENTYLRNAILNRSNRSFNSGTSTFFARVGNREFLGRMASFKFVNRNANQTAEHEVTDYFNMFEGGTAGGITTLVIVPHEPGYDLKPGEGEDGERKSVTKSITARHMFSPEVLRSAAQAVITKALAEIGSGQETA